MGRYRPRSRSPGRRRSRSHSPRRSRSPQRRSHREHHSRHADGAGGGHRHHSPPARQRERRRTRSRSRSRSPLLDRRGHGRGRYSRSPADDRRTERGGMHGSGARGHDRPRPLSPRQPSPGALDGPQGAPLSDTPPPVGTILQGEVQSVRPFGMFVRMAGYSRDGLVHSSQVSNEIEIARDDEDDMKVKAMEFVARKGETVWVKVVEAREEQPGRWRVGCSVKAVNQADGTDLDPGGLLGPGGQGARGGGQEGAPEVNTVHQATVRNIKPYGVFVQLDGWRRYGLVTVHQMSDHMGIGRDDSDEEKIAALQGVVSVEERIWVKVVEVTEDERGLRIGCSMKLVSQADGRDLDPNNLQYKPRGEGGGPGGRAPVGQSAGQVMGSKIDWGHLAAGEYQHGDQSKTYEILDDEEDEPQRAAAAGPRHPPGPPSPRLGQARGPPPPGGRGRGLTMPAWMTNPRAEESIPLGAPVHERSRAGGGAGISSVEEALAILERFKKKSKDKKSKDSKHKKHSKRKDHKSKHKSHKSSRKRRASASDSGSETD